jgi:hypothetical protein
MFIRIPRTGSHLRIARPGAAARSKLASNHSRHRLAHLYPPAELPRVPE